MAWAISFRRHQDTVVPGRKITNRLALAIVTRACFGSGSTAGGYFKPVSAQIALTMPFASPNETTPGASGAITRFSQA